MTLFTYEKYISIIPEETAKFIKTLLTYLYTTDSFKIDDEYIYAKEEKIFYKALKSYKKQSEINANILQQLTFKEKDELESTSLSSSTEKKLFTEYYEFFTPYPNEEIYRVLTPEDIIMHINKKITRFGNRTPDVFCCIEQTPGSFIKGLENIALMKKQTILEGLNKQFNKDLSINIVNYYETAGKLYIYLKTIMNDIEIIEHNDNDLIDLSMLLAVFYYKHVPTKGINEQEIILEYLESLGVTSKTIQEKLNIEINPTVVNQSTPTLILNTHFQDRLPKNTSREYITIEMLMKELINNTKSISIKKILGTLNVSTTSISNIEELVKKEKEQQNNTSLEELTKNLLPDVITYLKRVAQIYAYLISKKNTINQDLINEKSDYIVLSLLLSSYELPISDYNTFFFDNGITIDKLLELVKLPSLLTYMDELKNITPEESYIVELSPFVTSGVNNNKPKESITIESILINTTEKSRNKTSLIQKIYKTITNKVLNDNFKTQIDNHKKEKELKRKNELTETLLQNVSIEVYNYLRILSNYYYIISTKTSLDPKDKEQLAIIMAATKYDSKIEEYLNSLGITRGSLCKDFQVDFNYDEFPFDIDQINGPLRPYIFDRKPEEITVYSIFENAFIPQLTNSLKLRKALNNHSKKPEDFLGIEAKLTQYEKDKKIREEESDIKDTYSKCNDRAKQLLSLVLKIHTYLSKKNITIIKDYNDLQEISILIALFLNNNEYIPFFTHNGVTLEKVLSILNLTKEDMNEIYTISSNPSLILEYKKYLKSDTYTVDMKDIIVNLFNDKINPSQIIETITRMIDSNYSYLQEEVTNKKERKLSPEEYLTLLEAEPIEEIEPSLSKIATYGTNLATHSRHITDALHELVFSDALDSTIEDINKLASEIVYEETASPKKQSILKRLFSSQPEPKTIKKYQPTKITDLQDNISGQLTILQKEIIGYDLLRKYIEVFLVKLTEHLTKLKEYRQKLDSQEQTKDDVYSFTKNLQDQSIKEILDNKISTFETMILLMKQELVKVHRAIINHFITINALQTSKNAILPLLATEIAIGVGTTTNTEALEISNGLISLFQNVVNKNIEATMNNLQLLQQTSLTQEQLAPITSTVTAFISSISPSEEQPDSPQSLSLKPKNS